MKYSVQPMLATLVERPFDRKGWLFEIKWDGYRAIAETGKGKVRLYSRNGLSFEKKYPPVAAALRKLKRQAVLDGEIVAQKDGKSDFHTLQQYDERPVPLQYVVFDLLELDGKDLRARPLLERKKLLSKLLKKEGVII
ncbi:DNA ligase, partial [Candidatus Parcubacteria bacterium]|nr:DNA ligase [Candidatus Parcubacteria bacterium]